MITLLPIWIVILFQNEFFLFSDKKIGDGSQIDLSLCTI